MRRHHESTAFGSLQGEGANLAALAIALVAALAMAMLATPPPTAAAHTGQRAASQATGTVIGPGFYPRAVRLAHAGDQDGTILASYQLGGTGRIVRSTDDGVAFTEIAQIDVAGEFEAGGGPCCIQL